MVERAEKGEDVCRGGALVGPGAHEDDVRVGGPCRGVHRRAKVGAALLAQRLADAPGDEFGVARLAREDDRVVHGCPLGVRIVRGDDVVTLGLSAYTHISAA